MLRVVRAAERSQKGPSGIAAQAPSVRGSQVLEEDGSGLLGLLVRASLRGGGRGTCDPPWSR
eukprot:7156431-Pyramimonas_sp.AAC.1